MNYQKKIVMILHYGRQKRTQMVIFSGTVSGVKEGLDGIPNAL